jgi:uncharacterized protein (TIGR03083 family)
VEVAEYIEHVRREGTALADSAERAGLDASVPTCPEWQVRDLVRHQGDIHRWAAANLLRNSDELMSDEESGACLLTWPDDDAALLDWFREGHSQLVKTLESVPDDAVAFMFLAAPSPRAFWARRQAHETSIHRADAESANGPITAYDAEFAADGIDEIVRGFGSRPGKLVADPPRTLAIQPVDVARRWFVTLGPSGLVVTDSDEPGDCTVSGTASDIYLLLWNRRDAAGLDVTGDTGLLDVWRNSLQVRWGGPTRKD